MDGFNQLYRQHFPGVLRFAEAQAGRRDVAEDLVADAFRDLHRQFDTVPAERLAASLFDSVRSRAREFWRRQLAEQRHAQWLAGPAQSPHAAPAPPLWLSHPGLTSAERACLELHYVWDYSVTDIALRLGLGAEQVLAQIEDSSRPTGESKDVSRV